MYRIRSAVLFGNTVAARVRTAVLTGRTTKGAAIAANRLPPENAQGYEPITPLHSIFV